MCSLRCASALFFVHIVGLSIIASPSSQSDTKPSVAEIFEKHVYAWFPDNTVRRLSPAPGFFVQPCVDPEGKGAVFWGGAEGRPRIWFHDFVENIARLQAHFRIRIQFYLAIFDAHFFFSFFP